MSPVKASGALLSDRNIIASIAAAALLYTLDFPTLGTANTWEDQ